jgi:hypothetical protein
LSGKIYAGKVAGVAKTASVAGDEWRVIETLLPEGWQEKAREKGAFRRARYMKSPEQLLRLLLLHAAGGSLKQSAAEARAAGLVDKMSAPALFERMQKSTEWLGWIASKLSDSFRDPPVLPRGLRLRAVDSTTIEGPGNTTTEWRLHYALDLQTLHCDWHELTDAKGAESLARTPVRSGDILLGDRNYLLANPVRDVIAAGAHVLVRMRWRHPAMVDAKGKAVTALSLSKGVRVSRPGDFPVFLVSGDGSLVPGRIIAVKLPGPVAARNRKRLLRKASKKQRTLDNRSLQAASFVFLFTTLSAETLDTKGVANLYRFRWQIEIAFKRHKQILKLGALPHSDDRAAKSWILAKLVLAFLLETLYRNIIAISPWGYRIADLPA